MNPCTEDFDKAVLTITQDRARDYGDPTPHYQMVSDMKRMVSTCSDEEVRHALEMICLKVCRLVHNPYHLDSMVDIAGYARTIAMVTDHKFPNGVEGDRK